MLQFFIGANTAESSDNFKADITDTESSVVQSDPAVEGTANFKRKDITEITSNNVEQHASGKKKNKSTAKTNSNTREITVSTLAPATNYMMKVQSVYQVGDELWVISTTYLEEEIGGDLQIPIQITISVPADKKLTVKHKVFMDWNWGKKTKQPKYLSDLKKLDEQIKKNKGKQLPFKVFRNKKEWRSRKLT